MHNLSTCREVKIAEPVKPQPEILACKTCGYTGSKEEFGKGDRNQDGSIKYRNACLRCDRIRKQKYEVKRTQRRQARGAFA